MNATDELRRTEALLEELERLVVTGSLTGAQLAQLEGAVLPPLFVRARILRRAAGNWQAQATRQLELSEAGWLRMSPELARRRIRPAELDTITALYDTSATGWFSDYGFGPQLAAERQSRGFVLALTALGAFWLLSGKRGRA